MTDIELINSDLLDEEFSNWRFLGIGKPSASQIARKENRVANLEAKGKTDKAQALQSKIDEKGWNSGYQSGKGGETMIGGDQGSLPPHLRDQQKEEDVAKTEGAATEMLKAGTEGGAETVIGALPPDSQKIIGMKKSVAIPVMIGGGLVLATGLFFGIRAIMKAKKGKSSAK